MNCIDKVRHVMERAKADRLISLMFVWSSNAAKKDYLQELGDRYPFCPPDFLELLSIADGFDIYSFVIAGSPESEIRPIAELTGWIEDYVNCDQFMPIGNEASGRGIYLLSDDGRVSLTYSDTGETYFVANSFQQFLGEMLMGEKFWSLFRSRSDNEWSRFLKSEGWLSEC